MLGAEHFGFGISPEPALPLLAEGSPAFADSGEPKRIATLAEVEKNHILAALNHCKGNRTHAANLLDVSIRTLRNKLHEYNGTTPKPQTAEKDLLPTHSEDGT